MPERPCLLCVHAHPDDEALFSAGVMAKAHAEGIRSVLVTCTDGSLGFGIDGVGPHDAGHDREKVAALRRGELESAAKLLGVDRLVTLGYRDSGMVGWPQNDDRAAFIHQPLDEVTSRISAILDEDGPPDHIFTPLATMAAAGAAEFVERVYFPAIPESMLAAFLDLATGAGMVL